MGADNWFGWLKPSRDPEGVTKEETDSAFLFFFYQYFAKSTSFAKVVSVSALTDAAIWSKMFNFEIYIESYAQILG